MKLIDKSALVAEIERRVEAIANAPTGNNRELAAIQGAQQYELINLIQFINTLEVKEVDLDYIKNELDEVVRIYKPDGDFGWGTLYNVATHFFELGIKAQKGEE